MDKPNIPRLLLLLPYDPLITPSQKEVIKNAKVHQYMEEGLHRFHKYLEIKGISVDIFRVSLDYKFDLKDETLSYLFGPGKDMIDFNPYFYPYNFESMSLINEKTCKLDLSQYTAIGISLVISPSSSLNLTYKRPGPLLSTSTAIHRELNTISFKVVSATA